MVSARGVVVFKARIMVKLGVRFRVKVRAMVRLEHNCFYIQVFIYAIL